MFENIISRRINWYEDEFELSPEARDFMERLMCSDSAKRLGANGADEVKQHPFLQPVDWANLMQKEAAFVPQVTDPESTDYVRLLSEYANDPPVRLARGDRRRL